MTTAPPGNEFTSKPSAVSVLADKNTGAPSLCSFGIKISELWKHRQQSVGRLGAFQKRSSAIPSSVRMQTIQTGTLERRTTAMLAHK